MPRAAEPVPRLDPAPPGWRAWRSWPAELVARGAGVATHGDPPELFRALGRHPRLFRWWLPFGASLLFGGELPAADRELVILRVASNCASDYEWAQHVPLAVKAGLDVDLVPAVARGPSWPGWSPHRRLLLTAVDELHVDRVVSDATWSALTGALTERQRIELCMLAGHYAMLAGTLRSLGIQPEQSALASAVPGGPLPTSPVLTRRARGG